MTPDEPRPGSLPLFRAYPRLAETLPWIALGHWPTPVTRADRFAKSNGLASLHIKREDLSHPQSAGNKLRGLEFLLADAHRRGAKTIITASAAGSHHICKTAWHASRLGIRTVAIVVPQPPADYVAQNLLLSASVGAKIIPATFLTAAPKTMVQFMNPANWEGNRPPRWIPPGGTSPLSCIGHVNAIFELKSQIDDGQLPIPDYLYVALGSLGTAAGLAAGCALAGLPTQIVGIVVSYRWFATQGRWARLARRTIRLMRRFDPMVPDAALDPCRLHVVSSALGDGYAVPTESAAAAATQMHETEGLRLDGTYTSKVLEGMLQFIQDRGVSDSAHVFWHTYHAMDARPDLRAYVDKLPAALQCYL